MHILLDTHILLWMFMDDVRLKENVKKTLLDEANRLYCSDASVWEVALKHQKNPKENLSPKDFIDYVQASGILWLPVKRSHFVGVVELEQIHSDPFDRLLISQAISENIYLMSHDKFLGQYGYEKFISA